MLIKSKVLLGNQITTARPFFARCFAVLELELYLNFLLSSPTVLGAILTPTVNLNYQQYLVAAVIILAILAPCKTRLVFKLQAFYSISVLETLNQVS